MPYSHAEATASLNPVLSKVANRYSASMYTWFADVVAPPYVNNGEYSGQVPVYTTDALKNVEASRELGKETKQIDLSHVTYMTYDLPGKGLHFMEYEEENNKLVQGGMDPKLNLYFNIEQLKLALIIGRHRDLYTTISTTTNYQTNCINALSTAWSSDSSDPVADVKTSKIAYKENNFGSPAPNLMVFNDLTLTYLQHNASVLARLGRDRYQIASKQDLETLFGMKIHVTDCVYDSTLPAASTPSVGNIWGSVALIAYVNPNLNPRANGGFTFMRTICHKADMGMNQVFTYNKPELSGGWAKKHEIKDARWTHQKISVNDTTNKKSISAAIITGIYS